MEKRIFKGIKIVNTKDIISYQDGIFYLVHDVINDVDVYYIVFDGKTYAMPIDCSEFVTYEDFSSVEESALNSIQKGTLGTINGESLEDGNITLDLSLYKVVSKLPTENIDNNKIYFVPNAKSTSARTIFDEYVYNTEVTPNVWQKLGEYIPEIVLTDYLTKDDAEKKYVAKSSNTNSSINTDDKGAMANFSDNGQAYLAVRSKTVKFLMDIPYAAAAFGVKDDGTAAFSHKQYTTYEKTTGKYTGARNTAVLQFAGPVGLRYAKNTGSGTDVTEDMYKYVGVIGSPDVKQNVYSAKQVDDLLAEKDAIIEKLKQAIINLGGVIE